MYKIEQLNAMPIEELKAIAEKLGIKNYNKLNPTEVVFEILNHQALQPEPGSQEGYTSTHGQQRKHHPAKHYPKHETGSSSTVPNKDLKKEESQNTQNSDSKSEQKNPQSSQSTSSQESNHPDQPKPKKRGRPPKKIKKPETDHKEEILSIDKPQDSPQDKSQDRLQNRPQNQAQNRPQESSKKAIDEFAKEVSMMPEDDLFSSREETTEKPIKPVSEIEITDSAAQEAVAPEDKPQTQQPPAQKKEEHKPEYS